MDVCPAENTHIRAFLLIRITFKHDLGILGTISINFQNSKMAANEPVCPAENAHLRSFVLLRITLKHDLGMVGTISANFYSHYHLSVRAIGRTDIFIKTDISMLDSIFH